MDSLTLQPISRIAGEVNLPGSKSLSNRALLLAALAEGETHITNLLRSDDTGHMLTALSALGVGFELSSDGTSCVVEGADGVIGSNCSLNLFLGNAGTAMRPLCAALAAGSGDFTLTGEPRMGERPIGDLVDALKMLGAEIEYLAEPGFPPLRIRAAGLRGGPVSIDGSVSSQFLTALLMAAPLAEADCEIHIAGDLVSKPYIDITLHAMAAFGVSVENEDYRRFRVPSDRGYVSPGHFMVEGDASSASYFLAAGAIAGGEVKVTGIGSDSVQGDKMFADVLTAMGAEVHWSSESVTVRNGGGLRGVDLDLNHIPDAAMTIATTALFAEGRTVIRNVYNWRIKETDRLAAMATELRKLGATVEEGEDYIAIDPPQVLLPAAIDTYDDHRMAMCFSLAALGSVPVTINDPGCTAKTFPDYFSRLASISHY